MEALKKTKRAAKRNLGRLKEQMTPLYTAKNLDFRNLSKLEAIFNDFKEYRTTFRDTIDEMLKLADENDPNFAAWEKNMVSEVNEIDDLDFTIEAEIRTFRKKILSDESRQSLVSAASSSPNLNRSFIAGPQATPKLQKINIPTFDGDILNFNNFRRLFENLVHNNEELTNVQKLFYLKNAVTGAAAEIIRDFEFEERSYGEAWSYMLSRYDNPRSIIRNLFRRLHNLEKLKSENEIRKLMDQVDVILRGLKAAGEKIDDTFSRYIAFMVTELLDPNTAREWENSVTTSKTYPTYDQLQKFLQIRSFTAEDRSSDLSKKSPPKESLSKEKGEKTKAEKHERKSFVATSSSKFKGSPPTKCIMCTEAHYLNQCSKFKNLNQMERFNIVKNNHLCLKCFDSNHRLADCPRQNCWKCNGNHNFLLHREHEANADRTTTPSTAEKDSTQSSNLPSPLAANTVGQTTIAKTLMSSRADSRQIFVLATAVVLVLVNGKYVFARVLLDPCSETTLVSKKFIIRNKIVVHRNDSATTLFGVTKNPTVLDSSADLIIKSRYSKFQVAVKAEVISEIPYSLSAYVKDAHQNLPVLNYAELKLPYTEVDILLGVEYYELLLEDQRIFVENLTLRNTKFGYVISGAYKSSFFVSTKYSGLTRSETDDQLRKFWEIEESTENSSSTKKEESFESKFIEEKFEKTVSRNEEGRIVVDMLTKPSIENLNGSYNRALQVLKRTERHSSVETRKAYCDFMTEYENLGHMRKLTKGEIHFDRSYYIPHHIIARPTSTTTKHRVVFNASAVDNSGTSLNDCLYVGPVVQPELFDIVIQFRSHNIAFVADIEKMYRQVLIKTDQRRFQRILWRSDPQSEVEHYELNTVTYGTSSGSYLATKSLQYVANSVESSSPEVAKIIRNHFYMDDLMTGQTTVEDAIRMQKEVHQILESYCFPLRKYLSNSSEFISKLNPDLIASTSSKLLGSESFVYVLGLIWFHESDTFSVSLNLKELPSVVTKRIILSEVSKIFDVLGILSPVVIRAKIILQNLWREELKWDDVVSEELSCQFVNYYNDIKSLSNFSIPRRYSNFDRIKSFKLVGFCDASLKAYCAVVYARTIDENNRVDVKFICAKSRVAPLKELTIPRLELLSAVLLSKLTVRIARDLNVEKTNIYLFSDSTTVLSWLKTPVLQLKQFVGNRIRQILELVSFDSWRYVSTKFNPADLATRGLSAEQFLKTSSWTLGPKQLVDNFESMLANKPNVIGDIPEIKREKALCLSAHQEFCILDKYSSLEKLINVLIKVYSFGLRRRIADKSLSEIRNYVFNVIIRLSQARSFSLDITRLKEKRNLKKGSNLRSLDPFLDENKIIRVGGRLQNSNLPYNCKHPIILSTKCKLVRLLIVSLHEKYFHCDKNVIFSKLASEYWIIGGRNNLVKHLVRECILCKRIRAVTCSQLMGQLPIDRTMISRPFTYVGVDFTGHFLVKCLKHRTTKHDKVYAAFFVCFATRAIHIELVSDLTAENFLEALKRFTSRRGSPRCIYSDNGKNFVGANNIFSKQREKIIEWSAGEFINWKFIIPRTPHQGGLWESAVKSGKSLLLKATKNRVLTYEQLSTILCRVECVLNSRPLCYKSHANQEIEIITPGHFLIGDSLLNPANLDSLESTLDRRLTHVREIILSFWKTWSTSYLNELQRRNKWQERQPNLQVGDVVVIKEDNLPVLEWSMGKIIEVYEDSQRLVRNCKIKTSRGEVIRNVSRIVKLLSPEDCQPSVGGN